MRAKGLLVSIGMALLVTGVLPGQNQPLYPFGIDQDNLQGPPDFSFLTNSPRDPCCPKRRRLLV